MSGTQNKDKAERPLRDIKGLLKFCIEATRSEDAPADTQLEPMTSERREWLEAALTDTTVSPVERMSVCLKLIREAERDTEEGTEQQIKALKELQDWVEDIDLAADFIKINGLSIIPDFLSSEVSELRWSCLELVANLTQNNPFAQKSIVSLKLIPAFLSFTEFDPNPTVQVKALYAISCVVRGNQEAEREFLESGGMSTLIKAVSSDVEKVRTKATFLMTSLVQQNPALKGSLVTGGAVETLVKLLKTEEHNANHEYFMRSLLNIVTDHPDAKERCLRSELHLKPFLTERISFLQGEEAFEEELEYANELLKVLTQSSPNSSSNSSQDQRSKALMLR